MKLFDKELERGKRKGSHGYGWARPNARWCTTQKQNVVAAFSDGIESLFSKGAK